MKYIDSHAHIYADEFSEDIDEVLSTARDLGVSQICMPNIDVSSIESMHHLADQYGMCKPMMGLHPCYVKEDYEEQLQIIENWFADREYVGVGECGIDLYWDKTFVKEQERAFDTQIQWAKSLRKPIIIHSRDSLDLTISAIEQNQDGNLTGIFHCFNGTVEQAKRIVDIGFYMGIGGVITFKNAGVDKTVAQLPLEKMVLETDAPYLSPAPNRGKRNTPVYLPIIAEKLSEVLEVDLKKVSKTTTENCRLLFNF